jgi:hypothetical protein
VRHRRRNAGCIEQRRERREIARARVQGKEIQADALECRDALGELRLHRGTACSERLLVDTGAYADWIAMKSGESADLLEVRHRRRTGPDSYDNH